MLVSLAIFSAMLFFSGVCFAQTEDPIQSADSAPAPAQPPVAEPENDAGAQPPQSIPPAAQETNQVISPASSVADEPVAQTESAAVPDAPPDDPLARISWVAQKVAVKGIVSAGDQNMALLELPGQPLMHARVGFELPGLGIKVESISPQEIVLGLLTPVEGAAPEQQKAIIKP